MYKRGNEIVMVGEKNAYSYTERLVFWSCIKISF